MATKKTTRSILFYIYYLILLPLTKEVWGKVMFLHLSVILFTRGGVSQHAMEQTSPPSRADPPGQTHPSDTTGYGQQAGGTQPTGMHIYSIHLLKENLLHLKRPTTNDLYPLII